MKRLVLNFYGRIIGYGGCLRCGDTWNWKMAHATQYTHQKSCFPLCEECWSKIYIPQRLVYIF